MSNIFSFLLCELASQTRRNVEYGTGTGLPESANLARTLNSLCVNLLTCATSSFSIECRVYNIHILKPNRGLSTGIERAIHAKYYRTCIMRNITGRVSCEILPDVYHAEYYLTCIMRNTTGRVSCGILPEVYHAEYYLKCIMRNITGSV